VDHAQTVDGSFVSALVGLADTHDVTIVAGLLERADDGERVRNAVVAVDRTGLLAAYRKLHLYDAFGQRESDWVQPGEIAPPETFTVDGMRFGLMTCYDLRFPEVGRVLADAGADVVLVAAEWVRGPLKEHHWRTLLQARAIENTLFVAAADHPPPLGVGNSLIVDPQGVVAAGIGTTTDVAVAHLDREAVERVRRVNPALRLRRFRVEPA
jgi:predicted amidohydrolase